MIELENITKTFGKVNASNNVSCKIEFNKIHGFIGENGAGKSTLMKILAGFYKPSSGFIRMNKKIVRFNSPVDSQKSGIGMVHQKFSIINNLTVLENIILGDRRVPVLYSKSKISKEIQKLIDDVNLNIDVNAYIEDLSFSDMQLVEILKLLWRENEILIFDEPLSQLSFIESEKILNLIKSLVNDKSKTVIIVSHNISEMLKYCDNVSILRQGKLVKSTKTALVNEKEVAKMMIGAELENDYLNKRNNDLQEQKEDLISIENLTTKADKRHNTVDLKGVSLSLKRGEVLGLAGVKNNGQEDFMKVVFGITKPLLGQFKYKGKNIFWSEIKNKIKVISFIPGDPVKEGSTYNLPLYFNLLFKKIYNHRFNSSYFINKQDVLKEAKKLCDDYDINPRNPMILTKDLSGGNLQKSIIAREMDADWNLLLASNPLAGLDIKFSSNLFNSFYDLTRKEKKTIVLVANNIDQLFEICDRIAVFNRGQLMGVVTSDEFDKERISLLMGGVKQNS